MKCDVCSKTASPKRGYILSTAQLVYDPGYWQRAFSLIPLPVEKLDSRLPGFIAQMASSETDWVVCEECMGSLSQDRAQPAKYFEDYVKTGRRPRLPDRGPASFILAAINAGRAFEAKYGRKPDSLQPS